MFKRLYKQLNKDQKTAVDKIYGPVMVLAGPGTGKTQVISMRIANILIKTDASANNILCLTFTNSGVKAMRDRLAGIIGPEAYKINLHTFHSFCKELMNFYPERFLFAKKISQSTDLEEISFVKKILDEKDWEYLQTPKSPYYYVKSIKSAIGKLKQEGITIDEFKEIVKAAGDDIENNEDYYRKGKLMAKHQPLLNRINKNSELAEFYERYDQLMREAGRYDYNDMISFVLSELNRDEDWLANLQEKYQFVLVDEYQDTNGAQNELIELMGRRVEQPNVFVVGDDDQSIYRFQGANKENLLYFNVIFPDSQKIVLDKNYRSGQEIVQASQSLINHSEERVADDLDLIKQAQSALGKYNTKIEWGMFPTGESERLYIVERIKILLKQGVKPDEIAIFYRSNREAEDLMPMLVNHQIGYKRVGGENVINHALIDRLLQMISLLDNFHDDVRWHRVMYFDWWNINPGVIMRLMVDYRQSKRRSFYSWLKAEEKLDPTVSSMINTIEELKKTSANLNLVMMFDELVEKTGLMPQLLAAKNYEDLAVVKSFFDYLKNINNSRPDMKLEEFIKEIEDLREYEVEIKKNEYDFADAVNLMTAHSSKGLEFEYVFIYRAIDRHWNNKRAHDPLKIVDGVLKQSVGENQLEEERRLFYVAMTRAKRGLTITGSVNYYDREEKEKSATVFLKEIDEKYLNQIDTEKYFQSKDKWMNISDQAVIRQINRQEKEVLEKLVEDFCLSPTALNNFLECPRKFMYDNLLKVPRAKDLSASYGTAVHEALENFFTAFKKQNQLPDQSELLYFYEIALGKVGMREADYTQFLKKGKEDLTGYFESYEHEIIKPVYNEFDFGQGKVRLDDKIPLAGKVDRVELMSNSQELVRVIDYKTGKPKSRRAIQGLIKSAKDNYWNQLVFYQLLGDLSDRFIFKIAETEIDFIEPNPSGKYVKHRFVISSKDVANLKEVIRGVWDKISRLEFVCTDDKEICQGGFGGKPCDHNSYCRN